MAIDPTVGIILNFSAVAILGGVSAMAMGDSAGITAMISLNLCQT